MLLSVEPSNSGFTGSELTLNISSYGGDELSRSRTSATDSSDVWFKMIDATEGTFYDLLESHFTVSTDPLAHRSV